MALFLINNLKYSNYVKIDKTFLSPVYFKNN